MASATVFVDDATHGHLPPICVSTGAPAEAWIDYDKPVGGMGAAAWVLVLLGPIGWLALLLLGAFGAGRETLKVKLPYTESALERFLARRRVIKGGWVVALGSLILAFVLGGSIMPAQALIAAGGVGLLVALVYQLLVFFDEVDIELDASRRWVTLRGVHENFARAVEASRTSQGRL
jgi:hypothetical protein